MSDNRPDGAALQSSLLTTKLYPPPRRIDLVQRPRLTERLNESLQRQLTLISAPAGFGKTTLLSEWIPRSPRCVTWVALDKGDNDAIRFWSYVVTALQTLQADLGKNTQALLDSPNSPTIETILTSLANEIIAFPDALALVLDEGSDRACHCRPRLGSRGRFDRNGGAGTRPHTRRAGRLETYCQRLVQPRYRPQALCGDQHGETAYQQHLRQVECPQPHASGGEGEGNQAVVRVNSSFAFYGIPLS